MTKAKRTCLDCGTVTSHERCTICGHDRYGRAHQAERQAWAKAVRTGRVLCARCHQPIAADDTWNLDHLPNGERRPSHQACNIAAPD